MWLLGFVLLRFLPYSDFGNCSSAHHLSEPLGYCRWCAWCYWCCAVSSPAVEQQLWLPAPCGFFAVVHLVLPSVHHVQHHGTIWVTLRLAQTNHCSCCSAVPQFPRMPSASDGHLSSEGVWFLPVKLAGQATVSEGPAWSWCLQPMAYYALLYFFLGC